MSGHRSHAWVVVVANDDLLESALLSGSMVKRTETTGGVVALVSTAVSKENIRQLNAIFDLVVVRDTEIWNTGNGLKLENEKDLLLISTLSLGIFSKVIVLDAGVILGAQSDHLFDDDLEDNGAVLMMDKDGGNWKLVRIKPDVRKFRKLVRKMTLKETKKRNGLLGMALGRERRIMDGSLGHCEEAIKEDDLGGPEVTYVKEALAKKIRIKMEKTDKPEEEMEEDTKDWVAIVGMSCRFPGANSLSEYWDILSNGKNTCGVPSSERLLLSDLDPEIKANFLQAPVDHFDASFFGISPSEAVFTDPQARLLLEVSWEAFENGGINPEELRASKTGVFYGSWLQEYKEAVTANCSGSPSSEFLRKYLGNGFGCSAAKLSYFYGFTGPNVATESGCSSSMVAVDLAVKSLQRRECPVALACGANIILSMTRQAKLWAEDGRSKTFDVGADGYARAEGIAVLILKRYSDARRDGDRIHGVIRGSATSQEGLSKSFGTPTVDSECAAMRGALAAAKVDPSQVGYVEAHATGTSVGDPIEAAAIVKAYSSGEKREEPLWIGSGKTNIGHSESCSGMAGIFKVVLAMEREMIPEHVNLTKVNPLVDFSGIPGAIPVKSVPWQRSPGKPRIAGVSSFGITGTDAHVIIQEAPVENHPIRKLPSLEESKGLPRDQLFTLSAKSTAALDQLQDLFRVYLETTEDSLEDIIYTASCCRPHHPYRRAILGQSKTALVTQLLQSPVSSKLYPKSKICFTFPGRIGSMDLTSIRHLYDTVPFFQTTMDQCDALFQQVTASKVSLLSILFSSQHYPSMEWYALLPTCQYSLAQLWTHWGLHPSSVIGHCFGEISAAVVSGALELADAFRLVQVMPHFFHCQESHPAVMMAVNCGRDYCHRQISSFLQNNPSASHWIDISSENSADQTCVVAPPETMTHFKALLTGQGIRCKVIPMDFCAHSRAVEPALDIVMPEFHKLKHRPIRIPYVSSATGTLLKDADLNGLFWYKVIRNCVHFTTACDTVQEEGLGQILVEMGLDSALTRFTRDNVKDALCVPTFERGAGILTAVGELYTAGVNFSWKRLHDEGHRKRVTLPHYPFQRKSYWFERRAKCHLVPQMVPPAQFVHPFLGVPVAVPAGMEKIKVFQNDWLSESLEKEDTLFIRDHLIGSKVIFPGAAFLEMMMSAWRESENKMEGGFTVKNFAVHAPLLVDPEVPKRLQCVVNLEAGTISVYSSDKQGDKILWRLQASGKVVPEQDEKWTNLKPLNGTISGGRLSLNDDGLGRSNAEEFYMAAAQVGLNFGTTFKSMTGVHLMSNGDVIVEVNLASSVGNPEGEYVCHPILIDAMIQAYMTQKKPDLKRLHVPVQLGRFSVTPKMGEISNGPNQRFFVYCGKESAEVVLLDQHGHVVASMSKPELVATSVDSVLSAAGCDDKLKVPQNEDPSPIKYYEEFWQQARFYQGMDAIHGVIGGNVSFKELEASLNAMNDLTPEEAKLDESMDRICYLYVVKALFELGWTSALGFTAVQQNYLEYAVQWGVTPPLIPAFKAYLSYLSDDNSYQNEAQVDQELARLLDDPIIKGYAAMETVHECGVNLGGILKGVVNPHKILFGDRNLATSYYQNTRFRGIDGAAEQLFGYLVTKETVGDGVLKFLEIGGGSAAFTQKVVPILKKLGIRYQYHFTDISPTLLAKAQEIFSEEEKEAFVFKSLNVEIDPLSQGFPPNYFDVVVAIDVLHATKNLKDTLENVGRVTKVGGRIFLGETEKPVREADICFGILEGYWLFDDGIRKGHCTVGSQVWMELLGEKGFKEDQCRVLSCGGLMSLISARKSETGRVLEGVGKKEWIILSVGGKGVEEFRTGLERKTGRVGKVVEIQKGLEGNNLENLVSECLQRYQGGTLEGILVWLGNEDAGDKVDYKRVLEPLLYLGKYLIQAKLKTLPRLHLVSEGLWREDVPNSRVATAWGFLRNLRIELPGLISKSVDLEVGGRDVEHLITELWLDDKETEVVFREGTRLVRRLKEQKAKKKGEVTIPENGEYAVELPRSKVIGDVKFVEVREDDELEEFQVLVEVRSVSLNFKDVLAVMKPSADFEGLTSIGLDFAGVVSKVGEGVTRWKEGSCVFGSAWESGCMRSQLKTGEDSLMEVPASMTFAEAATLPAVFLTAWHCMVNVAKLRKGQTLLVHAASGGVGLAAIQIAKLLGVQVLGTAGSDRKRKFVRSLGVEHVFNSRTLEYKEGIMEVTSGHGVDMVLNCLTGPGFKEASLEVCRDGGHFVEISKLDILSEGEVQECRPLVKYDIVDVTQVDTPVITEMMDRLSTYLEQGIIKPLPYVTFSAGQLPDALSYLQKAQQIGKVIVNLPVKVEGHRKHLLFNDRSTYVITGGKGAIGLAVCKWMVSQGAKYVVLVGRRPANQEVQETLIQLNLDHGAAVISKEIDISDYPQIQKLLLDEIPSTLGFPPVRGIHHCAGVLSDKLILHQHWSNFDKVLRPKVQGAWNLHKVTENLALEHFLLYSSCASSFGHAGQSNYVSANAYLDSLAQLRQSLNLPGLSINWGLWKVGFGENVKVDWLHPFSLEEGISVLQEIMTEQPHNLSNLLAGGFDFTHLLKTAPYYKHTFFEHIPLEQSSFKKTPGKNQSGPQKNERKKEVSIFQRFKETEDFSERRKLAKEFVTKVLCETLGTSESEVREDVEFSEMGMDSLMSIEFTNKLYSEMEGGGGSGIDLEEHGTLNKLTEVVASILSKALEC